MTIPPEAVGVIASLVQAGVAGVIDLLSDDGKAAVRERLDVARERLPAPGSVARAVDEVLARRATFDRAHVQATAETVRERFHLDDTVQQSVALAAAGQPLTHEQRQLASIGARFLAAALRGEVAPTVPRVLDVPAGAWSETGRVDD